MKYIIIPTAKAAVIRRNLSLNLKDKNNTKNGIDKTTSALHIKDILLDNLIIKTSYKTYNNKNITTI